MCICCFYVRPFQCCKSWTSWPSRLIHPQVGYSSLLPFCPLTEVSQKFQQCKCSFVRVFYGSWNETFDMHNFIENFVVWIYWLDLCWSYIISMTNFTWLCLTCVWKPSVWPITYKGFVPCVWYSWTPSSIKESGLHFLSPYHVLNE